MRIIVLVTAALCLTGCATAEQREAAHQAKCLGYGLHTGTQIFVDCMTSLAQLDALDDDLRSKRMMVLGAAMQNSAAAMRANQPAPSRTLNCHSVPNGNAVDTTCF